MGSIICKESCEAFNESIKQHKNSTSKLPWYSNVQVDWNGCRKFPRLPAPGVHPRLFFTKDEIPAILARFTHCELGATLKQCLDHCRSHFLSRVYAHIENVESGEVDNPTLRETIDQFFVTNEQRNVTMLGAYAYGVIYEDAELVEKAMRYTLFYARVILRSREIALEQDVKTKPYNVWHTNNWDVNIARLFGDTSFALLYDLMYNDLTGEEVKMFRKAITSAVSGRRGWGMGWPTRKIQSNWAAYHGDLLVLCAAVEEEEGFDREVFAVFSDLMAHYLDYAFYDSGHPIEDSYVLNLGFREGSICFLVMARRGHNIFNHPHYKKVWTNWVPYALEPHNSGRVYGGSSGSDWTYPTSAIIAKYVFPKDSVIDHIYRHFMCEKGKKFGRLNKIQSRLVALAFAIPALSENFDEPEKPHELSLPLNFVCRDRGKVIMRSDWTEDAMWLTLDARPDAFLIGHDVCSRGVFVLNADGRAWGFCPEWKWYTESCDYSLPRIDGVGQMHKAPFVKLLDVTDGECGSTYASTDLTYAYNWTWTTWAKEGQNFRKQGYEPEPSDPRDFGYNVWWAPTKLYGERNVAFVGLHQWRKRFATVEKVTRSAMLVRAARPFTIVADNVKKDDEEHEYAWAMSTPDDVQLVSFDGTDAILTETEGSGRRFLIRSLCLDNVELQCSFHALEKLGETANRDDKARQIVLRCHANGVKFIFLMFSLPTAEFKAPETAWIEEGKLLEIHDQQTQETQRIEFGESESGAIEMKVLPVAQEPRSVNVII